MIYAPRKKSLNNVSLATAINSAIVQTNDQGMQKMRHLENTAYTSMPWKNGGGVTTEIIVHPAKAPMADFDWRISMANVAQDGPFSIFPGVDRTLCILGKA